MTTESQLIAAIAAAPDDPAPRLIYADFLEEHGSEHRPRIIRDVVAAESIASDVIAEKGWEPERRFDAYYPWAFWDESFYGEGTGHIPNHIHARLPGTWFTVSAISGRYYWTKREAYASLRTGFIRAWLAGYRETVEA